jgi:hypothetical protein
MNSICDFLEKGDWVKIRVNQGLIVWAQIDFIEHTIPIIGAKRGDKLFYVEPAYLIDACFLKNSMIKNTLINESIIKGEVNSDTHR